MANFNWGNFANIVLNSVIVLSIIILTYGAFRRYWRSRRRK